MDGSFLRFYVREGQSVHHRPAWEWLLECANRLGVRGGSAFRAIAGFGRHHTLHEEHFFELAGTLTIEVEFIVTDAERHELFEALRKEDVRLFYVQTPAHFGVINPDRRDPADVAQ